MHLIEGVVGFALALLQEAGTWELTEAPNGANIMGSKWFFT